MSSDPLASSSSPPSYPPLPLGANSVPFPSPPLSPEDLQRDIEAFPLGTPSMARYDAGEFLSQSLTDNHDTDPLLLKSKLQSQDHITALRRRTGSKKSRGVGAFYLRQNDQIASLLKSMDQHIEEAQEEEDTNRLQIKIAIWGSLGCNCVLAVLQIFAAVSSLSLSFFATAIDAVFDPLANFVLNYCHRKSLTVDLRAYPSGGSKFETIGDLVYSGVMGAVSVILVAFAIQNLVKGDPGEKELHIPAIVAVGIAFVTKLCLFIYCYSIRSKNSQVHVLWEDHRNDLFINGFGLFTSAAGVKIAWWIDPMGALIISVVLILVWGRTIYNHLTYLAGKAAPIEFQQLVIYKAMTFAHGIDKIDSCVVYHAGPDYVVELDVVMNRDTPLWKAHDLSQALQDKLEELPRVDRAFVHVDHETSHRPEHRKLK